MAYFPRAHIHELLAPDLLHQIIKGTFKDHIVSWVVEWMEAQDNGRTLVSEMDRRFELTLLSGLVKFYSIIYLFFQISIAAAPPFAGIRRFHEGCGFKQWTPRHS
jgi:hypothetical protein